MKTFKQHVKEALKDRDIPARAKYSKSGGFYYWPKPVKYNSIKKFYYHPKGAKPFPPGLHTKPTDKYEEVKEGYYMGGQVGSPTSNSTEDSALGAHNIQDPDVLKRVNAFVGSIAEREYIKPQFAVDELREKLHRIGLTVSPVDLNGDNGKVTAEVKQFGGRFGKDTDGSDINDDGISHRKEGGLKLEVSYETLKNGTSKVYAKLV